MMNIMRFLLNLILLSTFYLSSSQANISPLALKGLFKHFNGNKLYAPNIGCAALKNGTIHAIRFYNVIPGPIDDQGRRLYIQDSAPKEDPFAALAILLFPSPAGQLTAMTNNTQSIGAQLNVEDIATLLNFCAKVRTTVKSCEIMKNGEKLLFMGGNEFGNNFGSIIKRLQSAAQNQDDKDFFKNFLSNNRRFRIFLPQAQKLLSVLCKCIELEERDDRKTLHASNPEHYIHFEKYTEATFYPKYTPEMLLNAFFCLKFGSDDIPNLINNLDEEIVDHEVMFDSGLIDQTDLQNSIAQKTCDVTLDDLWIIQNKDLIESVIPYARRCKPVNNGLACGYNRESNQLLENKAFADCTETTIRHLCNLALYNKQTKDWNLHHALEKIKNIKTVDMLEAFYQLQKPEQANSGEKTIRNAWSKVVNNLDSKIRYNKKYLPLSCNNDNEVDSGLVNIMRVLNVVFELELQQEPFFHNDNQYAQDVRKWMENGLETFFKRVAPEKQNIDIRFNDVATYTASDKRKDCSAKITIQVNQDFKFLMKITPGHAQFDSITSLIPIDRKPVEEISCHHTQILQNSTGEQILLLSETKSVVTTCLHKLFSKNIIDSASIIIMLKQLHEMLKKNIISYPRGKSILQNALQSFLWEDQQMCKNIQPVIESFLGLKNNSIDEVLQHEVKTLIYNKKSDRFETEEQAHEFFKDIRWFIAENKINQKKITFSSDNCPNLKKINLALINLATINLDPLDVKANIELIEISGSFNELEEIHLPELGIKKLKIAGHYPKLKELIVHVYPQRMNALEAKLESIELSGSFNNLELICLQGTGIKKLKFSRGNFPNLKTLYLHELPKLESIELSGSFNTVRRIDITYSVIKKLKISSDNFPNLERISLKSTPKLESIELSGSFNNLGKIGLSHSKIKNLKLSGDNCPNLRKLGLKSTRNLESIELSGSFYRLHEINLLASEIKNLNISGDNCPHLRELCLICTRNLESIELSKSFNELQAINLAGSKIKELVLDKNLFPKLKRIVLES
jgi:hypothetical protein